MKYIKKILKIIPAIVGLTLMIIGVIGLAFLVSGETLLTKIDLL